VESSQASRAPDQGVESRLRPRTAGQRLARKPLFFLQETPLPCLTTVGHPFLWCWSPVLRLLASFALCLCSIPRSSDALKRRDGKDRLTRRLAGRCLRLAGRGRSPLRPAHLVDLSAQRRSALAKASPPISVPRLLDFRERSRFGSYFRGFQGGHRRLAGSQSEKNPCIIGVLRRSVLVNSNRPISAATTCADSERKSAANAHFGSKSIAELESERKQQGPVFTPNLNGVGVTGVLTFRVRIQK